MSNLSEYFHKQFNNLIRDRSNKSIIAASNVGVIVGLNKYENNRDYFRTISNRQRKCSDSINRNRAACQFGLEKENQAIQEFKLRHQIPESNGFCPPYLFTEANYQPVLTNQYQVSSCQKHSGQLNLGGKGDYFYLNADNQLVLLEIKCLATRKITECIPIHYYLQIQTMLYVYYLMKLPVKSALYCENTFTNDGKLGSYWEFEVELNLEYFQNQILPILGSYSKITDLSRNQPILPKKRSREESELTVQSFYQPKRKYNNALISRINFNQLYQSYLTTPTICGPGGLYNFFNNNHLHDWYKFNKNNTVDVYLPVNNQHKLKLAKQIGEQMWLKYLKPGKEIINLNLLNNQQQIDSTAHVFSPYKLAQTIQAVRHEKDIIIGGQLYHPIKAIWVNFDLLIRNDAFQTEKPHPKHYTPVKLITTNYNRENLSSKYAQIDLSLEIEVLKFYYSQPSYHSLILDVHGQIHEIIYDEKCKLSSCTKLDQALEWVETISLESKQLIIDPPSDNRLYPNCKKLSRDQEFEEFKNKLIQKNGELTQLWTVSQLKRNKLLQIGIHSIPELIINLKDPKKVKQIKEILGSSYFNIKNMLQANETNKIVRLLSLKRELNSIPKTGIEIYLDFEFLPNRVYLIGYKIKSNLKNNEQLDDMRQHILDSNCDDDSVKLANAFHQSIQNLMDLQKKIHKSTIIHHGRRSRSAPPGIMHSNGHPSPDRIQIRRITPTPSRSRVATPTPSRSRVSTPSRSRVSTPTTSRGLGGRGAPPELSVINCFHWGEVEERLIRKYFGQTYPLLNLIDLHQMSIDCHLGIPGCPNYSLKNIAKSLKNMDYIQTEWKENINGSWCNQIMSNLKSQEIRFPDIPEMDQILSYNSTDCQVLVDFVNLIRN